MQGSYTTRIGLAKIGIAFEPQYGLGVEVWVWPNLTGLSIRLFWPCFFIEFDRG